MTTDIDIVKFLFWEMERTRIYHVHIFSTLVTKKKKNQNEIIDLISDFEHTSD